MRQYDVLIIGAGAVGNAIAREISKKNKVSVAVLEKEPDTAFGISGRNSGVLHAGFNNRPGSFMAKLCVEGSQGFEEEAEALKLDFKKTGKLVIARHEEDLEKLSSLKMQGEKNGVKGLRIIGREELEKLVGYDAGAGALWSGMTGVFDPFLFTVALAEAAVHQGAEYFFGREVDGIEVFSEKLPEACSEKQQEAGSVLKNRFQITAKNHLTGQTETVQANILINSAGLFADEISRLAGAEAYKVYPCRGEYHILDKKQSAALELPIYPIPNENEGGLGVHLTPTLHGNIMIGPSAEYLASDQEREDYGTTGNVMDKLKKEGTDLFPQMEKMECIRSFSGVRPKLVSEETGGYADFVIEESKQIPGLIQLIGIESPGLTSSIPIGKMVARMTEEIASMPEKDVDSLPEESDSEGAFLDPSESNGEEPSLDPSESNGEETSLDPGDSKMLCRCEGITEAAVLEAYDRIIRIGAIPTIKGLKNRTRVTMGNCQGSFCTLNIIELLQKKRNFDPIELLWNGFESTLFKGRVRG